MVFRLRRLIGETGCTDSSSYITMAHSCYKWNDDAPYWIDIDEFEKLNKKAQEAARADIDEAIGHYKSALNLYRGEYLSESTYSDWIIPVRNYYRRLYLQCILQLTDLLRKKNNYYSIIEICEKALLLEPFEEEIHIRFLEALIKEGRTKQASSHYQYVTSSFYREMGIKPSPALRNIYRMIKAEKGGLELDLGTIQEKLKSSEEAKGPFFCDAELFRYLYNLERRRSVRKGQSSYLFLLTPSQRDYRALSPEEQKKIMTGLQDILASKLRIGDICCWWNESQFVILLSGITLEQSEKVIERIKAAFYIEGSVKKTEGQAHMLNPFLLEEASQAGLFSLQGTDMQKTKVLPFSALGEELQSALAGDKLSGFQETAAREKELRVKITLDEGFQASDIYLPSVTLQHAHYTAVTCGGELEGDSLIAIFNLDEIASWFTGQESETDTINFTITGRGWVEDITCASAPDLWRSWQASGSPAIPSSRPTAPTLTAASLTAWTNWKQAILSSSPPRKRAFPIR